VASKPPGRYTFGEFESFAVASRWRRCMIQQLLSRLRLRHKTSTWASGGLPGEVV
jgi:hypothetical protein